MKATLSAARENVAAVCSTVELALLETRNEFLEQEGWT